MGVFNVLGPKFFQFDMAIVREFRVRERENIQFRVEALTCSNDVRFNNPSVTLSNPKYFWQHHSAQDPRILQLAMKLPSDPWADHRVVWSALHWNRRESGRRLGPMVCPL